MEDMLTTKEAAEYLDVSMARIRQLIGAAQVCAQRNGKSWLVERASLDAYAATATPGRPATGSVRARVKKEGNSPVAYVLMNRGNEVARCVYDPLEQCFTQVEIVDEERVPLALCTYQAKIACARRSTNGGVAAVFPPVVGTSRPVCVSLRSKMPLSCLFGAGAFL